jgi:hypothetical protein
MSEEYSNWWSQEIKVSELRQLFRSMIEGYKDDIDDWKEYADAAREGMEFLRGMRSDEKMIFPIYANPHIQFIMMHAGIAILYGDDAYFTNTCGSNFDEYNERINYYNRDVKK